MRLLEMKQARKTVAKTQILDLFKHSEKALSHSEIEKSLNGICDRVTIYRVLARLVDEDAIHKIIDADGQNKYALCHHSEANHNHNHLHFSCTNCKTVTCVEDVEPAFSLPKEYQVSEINFTVTGICPKCSGAS